MYLGLPVWLAKLGPIALTSDSVNFASWREMRTFHFLAALLNVEVKNKNRVTPAYLR